MSSLTFTMTQLRQAALRYQTTEPLRWQEVQGIHRFLDRLTALAAQDDTCCLFCGMPLTDEPQCRYCGG